MPSDKTSSRFQLLPPHVLLAAICVSYALDRYLPVAQLWGSPCGTIGGIIVVLALAVNIFCALHFRWRETTVIPFQESSQLVTDGLFRWSRNPIYVSMVVVLVGFAIGWGSLSPWLVPPLFAWIIDRKFIQHEEAMLHDKFGGEYEEYCERVRRWL